MSQRLTHTLPVAGYGTYNGQINNAYTSSSSSYIPATNHYNSYHDNQPASVTSSQAGAQHWGYNNPVQTGPERGAYNPSSATQNYHYHASHHTVPAAEATQASIPYHAYNPSFEQYSNHPYTSTVTQSAEYSSGSLPRVNPGHPGHGMPSMNAAILQPSPHPAAHSLPYVDPYARPLRPVSSTSSPQEGSSRHAAFSRTRAPVPSPQILPREWYQSSAQPDSSSFYHSSQPTAQDLGPSVKVHDKEKHKPRKSSRSSKLGGIPKDQMQRFRVTDMGPGPSSSGTKRTRSPGSDALPEARKGKSKASLSAEEKEVAAKRKKEANRVQAYRDQFDDVYAELRALLYPDEENSKLAPSNHGKLKCIQDAVERIKNSVPHSIWQQEEARLYAEIRALRAEANAREARERELVVKNNAYVQAVNALQGTVDRLQRRLAAMGQMD